MLGFRITVKYHGFWHMLLVERIAKAAFERESRVQFNGCERQSRRRDATREQRRHWNARTCPLPLLYSFVKYLEDAVEKDIAWHIASLLLDYETRFKFPIYIAIDNNNITASRIDSRYLRIEMRKETIRNISRVHFIRYT